MWHAYSVDPVVTGCVHQISTLSNTCLYEYKTTDTGKLGLIQFSCQW